METREVQVPGEVKEFTAMKLAEFTERGLRTAQGDAVDFVDWFQTSSAAVGRSTPNLI